MCEREKKELTSSPGTFFFVISIHALAIRGENTYSSNHSAPAVVIIYAILFCLTDLSLYITLLMLLLAICIRVKYYIIYNTAANHSTGPSYIYIRMCIGLCMDDGQNFSLLGNGLYVWLIHNVLSLIFSSLSLSASFCFLPSSYV